MLWLCIILAVIVVAQMFIIKNITVKLEAYEDSNEELQYFVNKMHEQTVFVLSEIRKVDIRGSFEADDEVGIVFQGIKGMVETLSNFLLKDQDAEEEENR